MSMTLKRLLRTTLHKGISFEPVLGRMRNSRLSQKTVVLMYHELGDDCDDIEAWTVVKKSDFIRQMEYVCAHFDVLSLEDALARMENGTNAGARPSAVITFDDGYNGNRRVLLPIVKAMNLPVTVFVASRAVQEGLLYWYDRLISAFQGNTLRVLDLKRLSLGNYRINRYRGSENWREIERLLRDLKEMGPHARAAAVESILVELGPSAGNGSFSLGPLSTDELLALSESRLVIIGAHSHCHNILTQLSGEEIRESVRTSKELLEKWTGRSMRYFSYPNGNYNDTVVDIIKDLGFKCSFTTVARPWSKEDSVFTIPRIGIGRYDSIENFKIKVSGG
ncbi:MAG: polysaccharide deacetylase family protein [Deltaproteobacteria bacterium]|nr:polysaccharide deacetylase family protein [Deltaproteobacteria bacterium]